MPTSGGDGLPYSVTLSNKDATQQLAEMTRFFPIYSTSGGNLVFSSYTMPTQMPNSTLTSSMCGNSTTTSSESLTLSSINRSSAINDKAQEMVRCSSTPEIDVVSEGDQKEDDKMTKEKESLNMARNAHESNNGDEVQEKGPVSLADIIGRNVITGNYHLSDLLRAKAVEGVPSRQVCPFYGINSDLYLKNIRHSTSAFDNLNRKSHQANSLSIFAVDTLATPSVVKVPHASVPAHSKMLKIKTEDLDGSETGDNTQGSSNTSDLLETLGIKREHSEESISVAKALNGRMKLKYSNSKDDKSDQ